MYIAILFVAMIVMPINFISRGITIKAPPFQIIARGVLWTGFGILLILFLSDMLGNNVIEGISKMYEEAAKTLAGNGDIAEQLGIDKMSEGERIKYIESIYEIMEKSLIAVLFTFSSIICFLEYKILTSIRFKGDVPANQKALIRELNLDGGTLTGWFLIYIVAWLVKMSGMYFGEIAVLNVNILIESIFALQGISLLCYFIHMKQKPVVLAGVASGFLWLVPFGKQVLFVVGLLDIVLGLKKRVNS